MFFVGLGTLTIVGLIIVFGNGLLEGVIDDVGNNSTGVKIAVDKPVKFEKVLLSSVSSLFNERKLISKLP